MKKKEEEPKEIKISQDYCQSLKNLFSDMIISEVNRFLVDFGGGKITIPFYLNLPYGEKYKYYIIEDLDSSVGFDHLDELVLRTLAEFSEETHLLAIINGKNVKNVRFQIAKGLEELDDALDYKETVGINHRIYSNNGTDEYFLSEDKIVYVTK